jgi:superfamily I DNA and/or RNA helicase
LPLFFRSIADFKDIDYFVVVGDPLQLPCIARVPELGTSVINYLISPDMNGVVRVPNPVVLRTQFRMHPILAELVNEFGRQYGVILSSAPETRRTLEEDGYRGIPSHYSQELTEILDPRNVLVVIDTSQIPEEEIFCLGHITA